MNYLGEFQESKARIQDLSLVIVHLYHYNGSILSDQGTTPIAMRELQTVFKAMTVKLSEIQHHSETLQPQPRVQPSALPSKRLRMSQTVRQQKVRDSLKRIETQTERLNSLSAELEAAILELKAIAGEVNLDLQVIHATRKPSSGKSIGEFLTLAIPYVRQKPNGSLVLKARVVDLFKAEREAALLAQELRNRASKKRVRHN